MGLMLSPEVVKWARTRAGYSVEDMVKKFPQYRDWESGTAEISRSQRKKLAKAIYLSDGELLISNAPEENFMVPEFQAAKNRKTAKPSVHLLDILELCRSRQEWYRENAIYEGYGELSLVGSATPDSDPAAVASEIRKAINFDLEGRNQPFQDDRCLQDLVDKVESAGIMVMIGSTVNGFARRRFDVEEFRGFALCDKIAPLIFINGLDHVPGQIFTLCHELAHISLGKSAFATNPMSSRPKRGIEDLCNEVAAEILVPASDLENACLDEDEGVDDLLRRLKARYKVSDMIVLIRLRSIGAITKCVFEELYGSEVEKSMRRRKRAKEGYKAGIFSNQTLIKASSRKFLESLIPDILYGRTRYTDALRLLGIRGGGVFGDLAVEMGIK